MTGFFLYGKINRRKTKGNSPKEFKMTEKKDFFVIRQDMLEKKYYFIITERQREKSSNKQTPLSPNNDNSRAGRLNPQQDTHY